MPKWEDLMNAGGPCNEPDVRVLYYVEEEKDGVRRYSSLDAWDTDGKGNWKGTATTQRFQTEQVTPREGRLGNATPIRAALLDDLKELETDLRAEIAALRAEIAALRGDANLAPSTRENRPTA